MSLMRWAIPFLAVAVGGCAVTPPVEQSAVVIRGPQQSEAVKTAQKPEAKPTAKAKQTAKVKRRAKVKPPVKDGPKKRDLVTGGKSRLPKKSIAAKSPATKTALPKAIQKQITAAPTITEVRPAIVFKDIGTLVEKTPEPQPVSAPVVFAIEDAQPITVAEPQPVIVEAAIIPAALAPTNITSGLNYKAVSIEQVPPQIVPQAVVSHSITASRISGSKPMNLLTTFEQSGEAPNGRFGFILLDAATGQVLSEQNADEPLPPASTAKMLAAIAILEAKGMNGTFRTSLLADGSVSGGVLNGDLHLVGGGDPSLNRTDLSNLARRLASADIRSVNGRFFYHGDALPEVSIIDRNQSVGAVFNPGISALNLDWNQHRGASPVKNPSRYTAEGMRRAAQSAGVSLPVPTRGKGGGRGTEIASHDSAPVSAILTEMFDVSRNITAEVLGAAAAVELMRKPASLQDAARLNAEWARSAIGPIGGAEWSGFALENSSGLSKRSKITPRQMAAMTHYGYKRYGQAFKNIHESQSQGSSGGVSYEIATKFGTLSYVRGTTGFITLGGRDMVFAIMANDPARRLRNAKGWNNKARRLEQAIISDWLQNNWPTTQTASG